MTKAKKHWARSLTDALNMGTTVVAAVVLGYFGGRWLDTRFDTEPWLTVAGLMLGIATGMKVMWDRAMASGDSHSTKKDDNSSTED